MSINLLDLPLVLEEFELSADHELSYAFALDFKAKKLSLLHPHIKDIKDLLPRDWEVAALVICGEATNGEQRLGIRGFEEDLDPRAVLCSVDFPKRYAELCDRMAIGLPENISAYPQWKRPEETFTNGGFLLCRHDGVWDMVGLYPTELGPELGHAFLCVAICTTVPGCRELLLKSAEEVAKGTEILENALAKPPKHVPEQRSREHVASSESNPDNIFTRSRDLIKRVGYPQTQRLGLRSALKNLSQERLKVWRGAEGDQAALYNPRNLETLVAAFMLVTWDCGDCAHVEPLIYQNPSVLTLKQHNLLWFGLEQALTRSIADMNLDQVEDGAISMVEDDVVAAWIATASPETPEEYRHYILLHPKVQPGPLLYIFREEMKDSLTLEWE